MLDHICAERSGGVVVLGRLHQAVYHSIDVNMFRGFDVYIDGMRFLINLMLAIGGAEGFFRAVLILHGVRSSVRMDGLLRQVKRPGFDGRKIDCFFKLAAYGLGIKCIVRIISQLAVDFQLGNNVVALLFPVGDEVRPAVYRLAADIGALALAAPELEGVAVAGRGGSVCSGQSRTLAGRGRKQAVVSNAVCVGHVVNNILIVIDHADDVRPAVHGDGVQTCAFRVLLVLVPRAVVEPAVEVVLAGVVCGVVIGNVQLGQVNDRALGHLAKRLGVVSLGRVAVAVDDNLDGLLLFALDVDGQNDALVVLLVQKHPFCAVPLPLDLGFVFADLGVRGLGGVGIAGDVDVLVDGEGVEILAVFIDPGLRLVDTAVIAQAVHKAIEIRALLMLGLVVNAFDPDIHAGIARLAVSCGRDERPVGIQGVVSRCGDSRVSGNNRAVLCCGVPAVEGVAGAGRDGQFAVGFADLDDLGLIRLSQLIAAVRVEENVNSHDRPMRRQGGIGGDGRVEVELVVLIQIPACELTAFLLGGIRRGRFAFVFHGLREGGLAIVRVKGHDPVVRDRAHIIRTRRNRLCQPDVLLLCTCIGAYFRLSYLESPLDRILAQHIVSAWAVREALAVASLCASFNKLIHLERSNVTAGNGLSTAVLLLFNRHNVIWLHERYHETIGARGGLTVHTGCLDHVGASVNKFRDLIEGGRRVGDKHHIVNAGGLGLKIPLAAVVGERPIQRFRAVETVPVNGERVCVIRHGVFGSADLHHCVFVVRNRRIETILHSGVGHRVEALNGDQAIRKVSIGRLGDMIHPFCIVSLTSFKSGHFFAAEISTLIPVQEEAALFFRLSQLACFKHGVSGEGTVVGDSVNEMVSIFLLDQLSNVRICCVYNGCGRIRMSYIVVIVMTVELSNIRQAFTVRHVNDFQCALAKEHHTTDRGHALTERYLF